jgi:hypothetical protein
MTTTATMERGRMLAELLRLKIIGNEGHDLKVACVACPSSDAGRVHIDTGVYFCYSCNKALSAFDLCKVVLNDHDAAKRLMIEVGLFDDRPPSGNGSNGRSATPDVDIIAAVAGRKGVTKAAFLAYGATIKNGSVIWPTFRLVEPGKAERISTFRIDGENPQAKGRCEKGKPAGLFLPCQVKDGKGNVRSPAAGEEWIIVEGVKDAAALQSLGYNAIGLHGHGVQAEALPGFVAALAGVHLTFLPDADLPSEKGFRPLAGKCHGVAASVKVAALPVPQKESGGADVRDVLREQGPDAVRKAIDGAVPVNKDGQPDVPPRFVKVYTSKEFLALDLKANFLVRDVLVEGQPCIIGGRSKTLKTSLAIDLVVSLASATAFLHRFKTPNPVSAGIWIGESGAVTTRETAKRVAESHGVSLADLPITWGFDLPKLSAKGDLEALGKMIVARKLRVVLVDPLYLALLTAETAGNAGNVFAMGATLQPLTELGQDTGCTFILLHHFRKNSQAGEQEPAGLEELSQAGVAEWARQWILLQRQTPYQADGRHSLLMRAGGSAGHAGLWNVTINEGLLDPETFTGRQWDVSVQPVADARREAKRERENRKAAEQERQEGEHVERVVETMKRHPEGETARVLRLESRLNPDNFDKAFLRLEKDGRVEACEVVKGKKKYGSFRLKK